MKNKIIIIQRIIYYWLIKISNKGLERIRSQCNHEKYFISDYMWAPGHIEKNVNICTYCEKVI